MTFYFPVDETGKRIRTNADHGPVKDYDSYVFDIYSKYVPQPVDIRTCSVYDKYDILEEIGKFLTTITHIYSDINRPILIKNIQYTLNNWSQML